MLFEPRDKTDLPDQAVALSELGTALVEAGTIDARMLDRAQRVQAETGARLDRVLTSLGLLSERGLAEAMAKLLKSPLASPADYPDTPLYPDRLTARFLRTAGAMPIAVADGRTVLAMIDPFDTFTRNAVRAALSQPVATAVAIPIEFEAAFERLYPEADDSQDTVISLEQEVASTSPLEEDAERLRDLASEEPVIRLVNNMITRAVESWASDIHLEPLADRLRVRYRYDGILHEAESPPVRLQAAVISRIKIMARLDIAERRLPQDGRIKLTVRGREIDFRVSTIPSLHGETVVLRVLDRAAVQFDYDKLGFAPDVRNTVERSLERPNGLVLVTGPTGSGKTTTLYTGLLKLNTVSRMIVTVEDPIEYQLAGINQIQVKPHIGLNFATLLQSIVRQDPDIIMVGEIRNLETAQIAVQAALTGHLVLSTLHTNSAASSITRLRDMGVEDFLLTATLRAVLAQRLVRRLCPVCKVPEPASPDQIERFGLARLGHKEPLTLHRAAGCSECRDTGYRGRRAIGEVLALTPYIEKLIREGADDGAIERAAVAEGMRPIFESGMLAVLEGDTTIEEVVRSVHTDA